MKMMRRVLLGVLVIPAMIVDSIIDIFAIIYAFIYAIYGRFKYEISISESMSAFAANSSHQADYCIKLVGKMKFKSEEPTPSVPTNVLDVRQGDLMKRKRRINNEIFRSS